MHTLGVLRRSGRTVLALTVLHLVACTTLHPERVAPGQTREALRTAMGADPSARFALDAGGERWAYALGPQGLQTWLVDLDDQGRVTAVLPALTPQRLAQVQPGLSADALLRWLGPPAHRQREWQDKQTWSWRFDNPQCLWARITLSAQGQVVDAVAYPQDPRCDPDERGRHGGASR